MKRVLITGASGFVGSHLVRYLLAQNMEIWGTFRVPHIHTDLNPKVEWMGTELTDYYSVKELLSRIRPEVIIHLAGQSNVRNSWVNTSETMQSNIIATVNLLEGIREICPETFILTVGSSEEYGLIPIEEIPIHENTRPNPMNPYGVSKLSVALLVQQYAKTYGLKIIHARPFNHIGPGQGLGFVTTDFAKQIVEIELGYQKSTILVGNLDAERDFTDVRDIVIAYWELTQKGIPGEIYNVCSGTGIKISTILNELVSRSQIKIEIKQDPTKFRPVDVPYYIGNNSKIRSELGWSPMIDLSKTFDDIIDDWRSRLKH